MSQAGALSRQEIPLARSGVHPDSLLQPPRRCDVQGCTDESTFETEGEWRLHVVKHHCRVSTADGKRFVCPENECNKPLAQFDGLRGHYNTQHCLIHPFPCKHCNRLFATASLASTKHKCPQRPIMPERQAPYKHKPRVKRFKNMEAPHDPIAEAALPSPSQYIFTFEDATPASTPQSTPDTSATSSAYTTAPNTPPAHDVHDIPAVSFVPNPTWGSQQGEPAAVTPFVDQSVKPPTEPFTHDYNELNAVAGGSAVPGDNAVYAEAEFHLDKDTLGFLTDLLVKAQANPANNTGTTVAVDGDAAANDAFMTTDRYDAHHSSTYHDTTQGAVDQHSYIPQRPRVTPLAHYEPSYFTPKINAGPATDLEGTMQTEGMDKQPNMVAVDKMSKLMECMPSQTSYASPDAPSYHDMDPTPSVQRYPSTAPDMANFVAPASLVPQGNPYTHFNTNDVTSYPPPDSQWYNSVHESLWRSLFQRNPYRRTTPQEYKL